MISPSVEYVYFINFWLLYRENYSSFWKKIVMMILTDPRKGSSWLEENREVILFHPAQHASHIMCNHHDDNDCYQEWHLNSSWYHLLPQRGGQVKNFSLFHFFCWSWSSRLIIKSHHVYNKTLPDPWLLTLARKIAVKRESFDGVSTKMKRLSMKTC